jgi:hypothetical protein
MKLGNREKKLGITPVLRQAEDESEDPPSMTLYTPILQILEDTCS